MRIAIVGTGVSGLVAAHHLQREHDLELYEAGDHVGGHVHTHDVEIEGRRLAVDTGFIVFNDWTYPGFLALLEELGVVGQPSDMSFSVRCERTGLEYNGTSLDTLFAQRRNLLRPSFLRMIRDILRFNREAPGVLERPDPELTLGGYLERERYSRGFIEHYIVPMGAAIWSAAPQRMLEFPLTTFVRFFANHGMLSVDQRPQWHVVRGGSRAYVEALTRPLAERIHLRTPVLGVRRLAAGGVELELSEGRRVRRDAVVLALHSDQALRILRDPSPAEREVLGAIAYQANDAVLHTDGSLLPRRAKARAAWNYHVLRDPAAQSGHRVAVTYWMNQLQSLPVETPLCVTLNHGSAVDASKVIRRMTYHHPVYTRETIRAQGRRAEVSGVRDTYYCGAYWRYGFHEDGLQSGLDVVRELRARTAPGAIEVAGARP
jgi:predicted NAD/FAD-binding protein